MSCKGGNAFQPGLYTSGESRRYGYGSGRDPEIAELDCTCPDGQVYQIGGADESGALALCAAAGGTPVAATYRPLDGPSNVLACSTPSKMSAASIQDCAIANSSSQAKPSLLHWFWAFNHLVLAGGCRCCIPFWPLRHQHHNEQHHQQHCTQQRRSRLWRQDLDCEHRRERYRKEQQSGQCHHS